MQEVKTVRFMDADCDDEAVAIVRAGEGLIALALSLRHDGDVEVVLRPEECEALVEALQRAIATVGRPGV